MLGWNKKTVVIIEPAIFYFKYSCFQIRFKIIHTVKITKQTMNGVIDSKISFKNTGLVSELRWQSTENNSSKTFPD